jgi:hypothetical protein
LYLCMHGVSANRSWVVLNLAAERMNQN